MPCENCSNTEPVGMDNPFTRHKDCDHDDLSLFIEIPEGRVDLWRFMAVVDERLAQGDTRGARENLWAIGFLFESALFDPEYTARLLRTVRGLRDLAHVDEELKRLVDGGSP